MKATEEPHHDFMKLNMSEPGNESDHTNLDSTNSSTIPITKPFKEKPCFLGNCLSLWYHGANPLITIGPHWALYIVSNVFIIGLSFVFLHFLISQITIIGTSIGFFILCIQVFSYMMTALINPGIPDRNIIKSPQQFDEK